jgi:hypothetical protein
MSGLLITAIGVFFAVGITVGVITIVALSTVRAERRGQPGYERRYELDYQANQPAAPPAGAGRDRTVHQDHPRWPGDADNDLHEQ